MSPTCKVTVTQRCTLHFQDGNSVTAIVHTADADEQCPILYSGAVERLPHRIGVADPLLLRILFRSFARELKASYQEEQEGLDQTHDANELDADGAGPCQTSGRRNGRGKSLRCESLVQKARGE
jgi:hypothetical protein